MATSNGRVVGVFRRLVVGWLYGSGRVVLVKSRLVPQWW